MIGNYLSPWLFERIPTSVAIVAVIAVGQAIVVLTRHCDVSVGSVLGCTAYVPARPFVVAPGIPAPLVLVIATGMGRWRAR